MNLIYLAAQAADNGAEPGVFNLTWACPFWTFVIFVILMVVLAKYAFPPILDYAAAREQRIQEALDAAPPAGADGAAAGGTARRAGEGAPARAGDDCRGQGRRGAGARDHDPGDA
jgi:hypothetical protein